MRHVSSPRRNLLRFKKTGSAEERVRLIYRVSLVVHIRRSNTEERGGWQNGFLDRGSELVYDWGYPYSHVGSPAISADVELCIGMAFVFDFAAVRESRWVQASFGFAILSLRDLGAWMVRS